MINAILPLDNGHNSLTNTNMDAIDIDSLVPLPLSTSIVWKYFGFLSISGEIVDRNYVYCKRCKMRIKYSNNTSNLYKHFATHHASDYEQLYSLRKIRTGPDLADFSPLKRYKVANDNLLDTSHIKLDMIDPDPPYLVAGSDNDSVNNPSKTKENPMMSTPPTNRFLTSSYASSNQQTYARKPTSANQEPPSLNGEYPPNQFSYQNHVIPESSSTFTSGSPATAGQRKPIKSPDNMFKTNQWHNFYQNNNTASQAASSGVILDVLGALATVRRYCETNGLDLTLLQQLEKQIAVSELHRLSQ